MKEDPQEFETLRRLLALKRHEAPPPGYFESFSGRVINRIRSEDARPQNGLFGQLFELFRARPAVSWAFGVASAVVLLAAPALFESPQTAGVEGPPAGSSFAVKAAPGPVSSASFVFSTNFQSTQLVADPETPTNSLRDSLFDAPFYQRVEPVSFSPR